MKKELTKAELDAAEAAYAKESIKTVPLSARGQ